MKYCEKCKKAFISEDYKICPHCGSELEDVEIDGGKEVENEIENTDISNMKMSDRPQSPEGARESKRVRGVLCIFICIGFIIGGIAIWNNDDNKSLRANRDYIVSYYGSYSPKKSAIVDVEIKKALTLKCYIPIALMAICSVVSLGIAISNFNSYTAEMAELENSNNSNADNNKTE